MKSTIIILLITLVLFSPLDQSQDGQAQHGNGGMTFGISVLDHDIEITQVDEYRIHVSEKILCHNPDNESYSGKINCYIQEGSEITQFGPFINGSFRGGNYSQLNPVIVQYNLSDNGFEIPSNDSVQFNLEYDLSFPSNSFRYFKTFYYSNYFLVVSVYPISDTEVRTSHITLEYNEQGKYYVTHDSTVRVLGDTFSVQFSPEEESSNAALYLLLAVILIIAVIIIVQQIQSNNPDIRGTLTKKTGRSGSGKYYQGRSGSGKNKQGRSGSGKDSHVKVGSRKPDAGKEGTSGGWGKPKQESMGKGQTDEDLDALIEKKKNLLSAIKRLDEDHETGLLSDDIYSELKDEYKRKAVDVLKRIDGVK